MAEDRNGSSSGYALNIESFTKRLKTLYVHWKQNRQDLWGTCEAITAAAPPQSEDLRYLKSSALNIWLLGYEFPETIMVFMAKEVHFMCSQRKASLLEVLKKPAKSSLGINIVLHVKARNDAGIIQMKTMCEAIRAQSGSKVPVVGWIAKETPEGQLLEDWANKLRTSEFQLVDASTGFSEIFAVKDEPELTNIKKAAFLSASVLKNVVLPRLEVVIDDEKKVTHSELMDDTEKAVLDPQKAKVKLKADNVDICYPPVFQSGGKFDLRPGAVSNDDYLYYDATGVIICAIGSRYNSYCSNVARTYLIDAKDVQGKAYKVLLKAQEAAISALKPGNPVNAAYKAAIEVVQRDGPELLPHLTKSAGTGIGIEFRESGLSLNARNDKCLKAGMAFNVSLGFQNLQVQTSNPKTQNFSLLLADTVVIKDKGPENATGVSSKVYTDVAYSFNEEEEKEEKSKPKAEVNGIESGFSKATLRSDNQEMTKEEQRRQHQAELARQKNEETARRLASGGIGTGDGHGSSKTSTEMVAYKNVDDIPFLRELMIQVDTKNDAVLVPIYGIMVPFHIATIKSVTSQHDGGNSYIRIIFNVPGTGFNVNYTPTMKFPSSIYVKEISFRSKDQRHINQVVQMIKSHRRSVAMKESERAERATLVTQEKLQLSKTKPTRLTDLWIRPVFGGRGRKMTGTLEAHHNGFRYSTMRAQERVDIMYQNIKHAFFQPAEKEMITLLHFHLHNHIMVGTKKTKDVQFYVEVMDVVQTLGGSRRSMYDPDEIEEEQQERDRKNKINAEFQGFVKRVTELWEQPHLKDFELEFDIPFRELGFHGVPFKATAFIVPTVNCLVELVEIPFLVITISEIEIVNLERVGLGQKAFDMAVVFKDFKREVLRIDAIPSSSLDGIKEWLNSMDIKYYESRMNLNWRPILKTITDDPDKFIEDGGWEFLNMEASDSDMENSQESDQGYEPSDIEEESESDDEDSEDESLVESDEDEEEEDDSEEEGKTWDELELEARNADKENGDESDSEEERRRRKVKAAGKSRVSDIRGSRGMSAKRHKVR
ncbi:FACT complex subunit SPT16 isoform X1 [Cryptomeria japonica]|uniref:FACT complex subunit SPT16 isoform X1 n=2 Tax=Cryptomeria japonica TaxID=3369 RepID=UPI0027DA6206|nr:FACT complex subunit SPT16 isoform X1 [Cryptomeria japonica]XP_057869395.2 FACT complex subunit SPT16 isoform X1 [Cryptomeria japonica]XP_057869396.2 FACT complex subunit SPT16 isoform X1 [Cryptomeria japonica]